MDNLTHTLVGVAMANAGLARRIGRGTTLTLAVASNLPDVDAVTALWLRWDFFLARRTLTHSVIGVPLLAALGAWVASRYYPHIPRRVLFGLFLLGMVVHVLFDLVNSYGVVLFYPLSERRFELAWVFIVDLALLALLCMPLALTRLSPWMLARLETLSRLSLAATAGYILLCGAAHARAVEALDAIARQESPRPSFSYVFPEVLGCHRFRAVVRQKERYRLYLVDVLSGEGELRAVHRTDEGTPDVEAVRATVAARRLLAFYKAPVWRGDGVEGCAQGSGVVTVYDLRFVTTVIERGTPFAFRFRRTRQGVEGPILDSREHGFTGRSLVGEGPSPPRAPLTRRPPRGR